MAGLLACVVAVLFRLYPLFVYPYYEALNNARIAVYSNIQRTVEKQVDTVYRTESEDTKKKLRVQGLQTILKNSDDKIRQAIRETSERFLSERTRSHYLLEVDSYYYLSLTKKVLEKGSFFSKRRGNEYLNEQMLAPEGGWYPIDLHPFMGAVFYQVLSLFNPHFPLPEALGWLTVALSCLAVPLFFWIARKSLNAGVLEAGLAALFLVLAPIFLRRTLQGWFDTDAYNILFPVAVTGLLLCALSPTIQTRKARLLTALAAAAVICAHSLFWRGWSLFFFMVLFATVAAALGSRTKKGYPFLDLCLVFLIIFTVPIIFSGIAWGPAGLTNFFSETATFVQRFLKPSFNGWPDIFITVGELLPGGFRDVLSQTGGPFFYALAGIGVISFIIGRSPASWFLAMLFMTASFLGCRIERLSLLLLSPMAFAILLGIRQCWSWYKKSALLKTVFAGIFLGVLFLNAHASVRYEHPIYNDTWNRSMTYLKKETPENSIVTTWWSPGHFITGMGERRVTFDGASQNTPQAYWVARLFLETSEKKALAILQMLDASGNKGVEWLVARGYSLPRAITMVDNLLGMSRAEAASWLESQKELNPFQELLNMVKPQVSSLPPSYLFVYDDMVEKAMAMEYVGRWDFERALDFSAAVAEGFEKIPSNSSVDYPKLLWNLSDKPSAQGKVSFESGSDTRGMRFTNGLWIAKDFSAAVLLEGEFGRGPVRYLYTVENGEFRKKELSGARLNLGVLLFKDATGGSAYKAVVAAPRLIESMAFRLYYLNGAGLTHFKPVNHEQDVQDRTILSTFETVWDPSA